MGLFEAMAEVEHREGEGEGEGEAMAEAEHRELYVGLEAACVRRS